MSARLATTPGSVGYPATLNIQEIVETRTVEDVTDGASANVIYDAAPIKRLRPCYRERSCVLTARRRRSRDT